GLTNDNLRLKQVLMGKVEIFIPKGFVSMKEEMIQAKYPTKSISNSEVFTNEEATINIAFEHTQNKSTLEELPEFLSIFKHQFSHPSIDFKKGEIEKINNRDWIILEMITPAVETEVY